MRKVWFLLAAVVIFLTGCGGSTWYGSGTVVDKRMIYDGAMSWGENKNPVKHKECYYLKIYDDHGVEREGCVGSRVWEDAMLGHQITITKDYN